MEKDPVKVGVTIDFLGTLVELDHDVPTIAQELTKRGYPCSPEVENIWNSSGFDGLSTNDGHLQTYREWRQTAIARLAELCGAPKAEARQLAMELIRLDQMWTVKAAPAAKQLLLTLEQQKMPFCILSNWDYPLAPYLRMAGLNESTRAVLSADIGIRKPASEAFERARRLLEIEPEEHVHIGDSWSADIVGAIRSGARAIWITPGPPAFELPTRIRAMSLHQVTGLLLGLSRGIPFAQA